MKRMTRAALAVAVVGLALAGCSTPPPALPSSVLAQGADALPEEHPKLTAQQVSLCDQCHRTSDAPAP